MEMNALLSNTQAEKFNQLMAARAVSSNRVITKDELVNKAKKDIALLETRGWKIGEGYKAPHFPLLTSKLEGLETGGLYLFAGESNVGKSMIMMNLFWDLVLNPENKLYGIYFSLDDAKTEIYPRIIAMQQMIPIGCVKKPKVYEDKAKTNDPVYSHYLDYLAKRKVGFEDLINQAEHINVFDLSSEEEGCSNDQDIYNTIKKIQSAVKKVDPSANIIVAIDAIDDIRPKTEVLDKADHIARAVKHWAVELDITIFASKHLKKLGANRLPTLDDLRDSNTLVYEASVIFMVTNDVSKNNQQAKVFYLGEDGETKQPVVGLSWAKNKKSSFKGMTFAHFIPDFSKASECSEAQGKHYESSLYSL